jgi:hypothetical protein
MRNVSASIRLKVRFLVFENAIDVSEAITKHMWIEIDDKITVIDIIAKTDDAITYRPFRLIAPPMPVNAEEFRRTILGSNNLKDM